MNFSKIVLLLMTLSVTRGDISDTNPPSNICICVNSDSCNVRDSACGTVVDIATTDNCYVYTGEKTSCSISEEVVSYFELDVNVQSGWIDGVNLIFGIGPECGIPDECASISCQNGGRCFNRVDGYACECAPGFDGIHCEIGLNQCDSSPCQNGGTCQDRGALGYVCTCLPIFSGQQCESKTNALMLYNDVFGSDSYFFNKSRSQFQQGFGDPSSNYWIGLDMLNLLTTQYTCAVSFDLLIRAGTWYYARYSSFRVGNPSTNFTLSIGGYTGNLNDAMAYSNNLPFSTYDFDIDNNDGHNCAKVHGGGFWYNAGANAMITGSPSSGFNWSGTTLNQCSVTLIC